MSKGMTSAVQEGVEGSISLVGVPCREWRITVERDRRDEGLETKLVEQDAFARIVLGNVEYDQIRPPCLPRFTWFLSAKAVDDEGVEPFGVIGVVAVRPGSGGCGDDGCRAECAVQLRWKIGREVIWQASDRNEGTRPQTGVRRSLATRAMGMVTLSSSSGSNAVIRRPRRSSVGNGRSGRC